jgi:hypothetical protein
VYACYKLFAVGKHTNKGIEVNSIIIVTFEYKFIDVVLIVRTLGDFLIQNFVFTNLRTIYFHKILNC